ncbi:MAG TPA: 3-hydroxyacyl-CoA dehydrogenase NAD-binding domain-containing protein, partial [bacterium]|nr:3-hydroxyacyl-CoA dehydrogenase NAD-binding domain-containing protein [bacterium]
MTKRRIGVVGAGNMGSGIAQKCATEGFEVVLVDMNEEAAQRGKTRIDELLQEGVARKVFTADVARDIAGRVQATANLESVRDCEIVIEAVFEDLGVKRDLFARLDKITGPDTILATNTSSFLVDDVASATKTPERVVGLHYFYHPAKNRLVEVIPGSRTSKEVRERAWI